MRVLPFSNAAEIAVALEPVAAHLRQGGVLGYPTETMYGLGSGITDRDLACLAALKPRSAAKPFLLLVSDRRMAMNLGLRFDAEADALAETFWPGPLTLVLPGGDERLPDALRGPSGGVAVRMTSHQAVRELVAHLGHPITSTSANLPGRDPVQDAQGVARLFGDRTGELLVLDGGTCMQTIPSTIVDCVSVPRVVRAGAISRVALESSAARLAW